MENKNTIEKITAREILDSRGVPTVEAEVWLKSGLSAKASVPSGTSTSRHAACELRDGDVGRYQGLGVLQACANVNESISRVLKGQDVSHQKNIDQEMIELDGTENLRKLGANAVLAVSLAVARAGAMAQGLPLYKYIKENFQFPISNFQLPIPLFNIFNGGKHADTNLDFQEFLIIPSGITKSFSEQLRAGAEIFHNLKEVLLKNDLDTDTGIEGGYAPNIDNTLQALDLIMEAINQADYKQGQEIWLGVDVGASVLYDQDREIYHFGLLDHDMTADQLISLYHDWTQKYPFIYIEDGLYEDDWANWRALTREFQDWRADFLIAGDDIFATKTQRLQAGLDQQVANSVLVKPNQVGTLTATCEFIKLAQKHDYKVIVSHRSGETNDAFIADLAVAVGADYIKAGSLSRGERLAKYNRLLEIEQELMQNHES